mmetsp:Transcript_46658/g.99013  ORF Transcript_46658/g.99013 Transcript_46658/m.99013 type:complete len:259 (+) Transcript_46658:140-916(+)
MPRQSTSSTDRSRSPSCTLPHRTLPSLTANILGMSSLMLAMSSPSFPGGAATVMLSKTASMSPPPSSPPSRTALSSPSSLSEPAHDASSDPSFRCRTNPLDLPLLIVQHTAKHASRTHRETTTATTAYNAAVPSPPPSPSFSDRAAASENSNAGASTATGRPSTSRDTRPTPSKAPLPSPGRALSSSRYSSHCFWVSNPEATASFGSRAIGPFSEMKLMMVTKLIRREVGRSPRRYPPCRLGVSFSIDTSGDAVVASR